MNNYDKFRNLTTNSSAEEKLMTIRSESIRIVGSVSGYAALMLHILEERTAPELPDDFKVWCKKVVDGTQEMRDLIDALTDPRHRTLLQQEYENQKRQFNEEEWKVMQAKVPELQQYKSFVQAVEQTAHKLGLALTETQVEKIAINAPFYPGGFVELRGRDRHAHIGAQFSYGIHIGYAITLQWCSDKRNMTWQEHKGYIASLTEAVTTLNRWLVEDWDLERIKLECPYLNSGTV